jgi:hypothetical protein
MPRGKQNETIIVDLGSDYDSEDVLLQLEDTYGKIEDFTQISLHRKQPDGNYSLLKKFNTLPDLEHIIKTYGGGDFKLYLQWLDPESPGKKYKDRRHIQTRLFSIEGNAITPKYGSDEQQKDKPKDSVDELIRLKNAGLFGNNNNSDASMALILKSLENQNALMIKMLELSKNNGVDKTSEFLMKLALKNNETDLDKIIKYKDLFAGTPEDSGTLGQISKIAGPFMEMMQTRSGTGTDGTLKQMLTNIIKHNQIILQNIDLIIADHNKLETRFNELENDYYVDEEDSNEITNETSPDAQVIQDLNFNDNQMPDLNFLKEKLKTATPEDKTEILRQWLYDYKTPEAAVKEFCLNTGLAKDVSEYAEYKRKADAKQIGLKK